MTMSAEERLGSHIKRAEQAMQATKTAVLKPAGVTVPQYAALLVLCDNPGISAAALARHCGVTPPTMNTVLANLRDRGLIERTQHAWHKNVLETRLTEEGAKVLREADRAGTRVERAVADEFTEAEFATLVELLARATAVYEGQRPD